MKELKSVNSIILIHKFQLIDHLFNFFFLLHLNINIILYLKIFSIEFKIK